ncbi:MAG: response regulator [Clostridia bacterium]
MYKLLIVEDEDLIRNAIVSGVDWHSLGFEAEGAEDGEVALEIVRRFRPDIVLTDIRMPFMDGLELTRAIKKQFPQTVVVILSGHDEFSYAQEALQLGVKKYIQKPIVPADLIRIMQDLVAELNAIASRKNNMQKLRLQVQASMPILREKLLNRLLHNTISPAEIPQMLDFTGLRLRGQGYTVCLLECEPDEAVNGEAAAMLNLSISQILEHELGSDGIAFESSTGRRVFIYLARTQETERPYVVELLGEISDAIFNAHGIVTTCAIGTRVTTLPELHISYESAKVALEQRIFDGRGKIYDAYKLQNAQNYYPFALSQNLLDKLKLQSAQEFSSSLSSFFDDLRQMRALTSEILLTIMLDLVNCGHRILLESGCKDEQNTHKIYSELFSLTTLDQYQLTITRFFTLLRNKLESQRSTKGGQLIGNICRHISDHFCDPALSLNSVAASVYISPTYLSILFKKEMGTTFIEYVSRLRMERAKELLQDSNLKTYEAAERTGYNDPQYFSSCFKKYTGFTPSEYKAQLSARREMKG